ncbi:hypothetical protein MiTs_00382 [Microcystis aeruginosa NIES-2521]|uniref:Uncharacterized protein n=1 Tax=Microcystis aeruginosa NIES-2521 TaxID=2303983 RepID=A0A5A5RPD1_MICAE|nr:hypothetical protein MiTs_00382 [Microcystis aeruginosa NIES-2521]
MSQLNGGGGNILPRSQVLPGNAIFRFYLKIFPVAAALSRGERNSPLQGFFARSHFNIGTVGWAMPTLPIFPEY